MISMKFILLHLIHRDNSPYEFALRQCIISFLVDDYDVDKHCFICMFACESFLRVKLDSMPPCVLFLLSFRSAHDVISLFRGRDSFQFFTQAAWLPVDSLSKEDQRD